MVALIAPEGLRIVDDLHREPTQVRMAWNHVPNASAYVVYWLPHGAANGTESHAGYVTETTLTGLFPNGEYDVRVRALAKPGDTDSDWSSPVFLVTKLPTPPSLQVFSFGMTNIGVRLSWDVPPGAIQRTDTVSAEIKAEEVTGAARFVAGGPFRLHGYVDDRVIGSMRYSMRLVAPAQNLPDGINASDWSPFVEIVVGVFGGLAVPGLEQSRWQRRQIILTHLN